MDDTPVPLVPVNEIRDYLQVNAQVAKILDAGAHRIRLTGVEGQRLLLSGLTGSWRAIIEMEGRAGPELAAAIDSPELIVVAHGGAADGAGRGLRAGSLLLLGPSGPGLAYRQAGGLVLAFDAIGPRAGLEQQAGRLLLMGPAGPLAGERQAGGRLLVLGQPRPATAGHAHRGGFLGFDPRDLDAADRRVLARCAHALDGRLPADAATRLSHLLGRPGASPS
jgi:glutamate synthase domain-containing protein 3